MANEFSLESLKNIGRATIESGQANRMVYDNILAGYNPRSSEEFKERPQLNEDRQERTDNFVADMTAQDEAAAALRDDPDRIKVTQPTSLGDKYLDMSAGVLSGAAGMFAGVAQNFASDPDTIRAISGVTEGINEGLKGMRSERSIQDQNIQARKLASHRQALDNLIADGSITPMQAEFEMVKATFNTSTVDTNISLVGQGLGSLLGMAAGGVALRLAGAGVKAVSVGTYGLGVASAFGSTKEQVLQELDTIPNSDWSKSEFAQNLIAQGLSYQDAIEVTKAKAVEDAYFSLANLTQAGISGAVDKFALSKSAGLKSFLKGFITKPIAEGTEEVFQSSVQQGLTNYQYMEKAGEAGDGRTLSYGMGQGAVEGLIGGLGAGAGGHAIGGVASAVSAAAEVGKAVTETVRDTSNKRNLDSVSENKEARDQAINNIEDPDKAQQVRESFDQVDSILAFDFDRDTEGLSDVVKEKVREAEITGIEDYTTTLAGIASSGDLSVSDRAAIIAKIRETSERIMESSQATEEIARDKSIDKTIRSDANKARKGLDAINPDQAKLDQDTINLRQEAKALPITVDENSTPEQVSEAAKNAATIISIGAIEGKTDFDLSPLLRHIETNGIESVGITENQHKALSTLNNFLQSNKEFMEDLKNSDPSKDGSTKGVQYSVLFGNNEYQKGRSGADYIADIYNSIANGNTKKLEATMLRLENFAQNQKNKATALENTLKTKQSTPYTAFSYDSGKEVQKEHKVSFGNEKAGTPADKERQVRNLLKNVNREAAILDSLVQASRNIIEGGDLDSINNQITAVDSEISNVNTRTNVAEDTSRQEVQEPTVSAIQDDFLNESQVEPEASEETTPGQRKDETKASTKTAPMENTSTEYDSRTSADGSVVVTVPDSPRVYTISPDKKTITVRSTNTGREVPVDVDNPQPAVAGFVNKLKNDGLLSTPEAETVETRVTEEPAATNTPAQVEFKGEYDYVENPDGTIAVTVEGQQREYLFSADGKTLTVTGTVSGNTRRYVTNNAPKSMQGLIYQLTKDGIIDPSDAPTNVKKKSEVTPDQQEQGLDSNQSSTSQEVSRPVSVSEAYPDVQENTYLARANKVRKGAIAPLLTDGKAIMDKLRETLGTHTQAIKDAYTQLLIKPKNPSHKSMNKVIYDELGKLIEDMNSKKYVRDLINNNRNEDGSVNLEAVRGSFSNRILEFAVFNPETEMFELNKKIGLISALTGVDTILNFKDITQREFEPEENTFNSPIWGIVKALKNDGVPLSDPSVMDLSNAILNARDEQGNLLYPIEILNSSVSSLELTDALYNNLRDMLGLTVNRDSTPLEAATSLQSLALEMINALVSAGILETYTINGRNLGSNKNLNMYRVSNNAQNFLDNLTQDGGLVRSVIKDSFTTEKGSGITFEPEKLTVSRTVNRSSLPLGREAQQAIAQAQKTKFFMDTNMFDLVKDLSKEGLLYLFGGYSDLNTAYKPIEATLKGRDITVSNAWQTALDTMEALKSRAEFIGSEDIGSIPMFYKFGMSVVSRLSPIGSYNPVSDTTMRELVVSTKGQVNTDKHKVYIELALAQGFDIGIEKMTYPQAMESLASVVQKLPKSISILDSYVTNPKAFSNQDLTDLKTEFEDAGLPMNLRSLKTLREYVIYQQALKNGTKDYESTLYIEADGISNGYVMANGMFGADLASNTWLEVLERGGITIGQANKAYADFLTKEGSYDNYQGIANGTSAKIAESDQIYRDFSNVISGSDNTDYSKASSQDRLKKAIEMKRNTMFVIGSLLGQVSFENGNFVIKRNQVKDPATQTNYGAGDLSKSRTIAKALIDEITVRINDAHNKMKRGQFTNFENALADSFFPNEVNMNNKVTRLRKLREVLENNDTGLFSTYFTLNYEKEAVFSKRKSSTNPSDYRINFNGNAKEVISRDAFDMLTGNIQRAFTVNVSKAQEEYNPVLAGNMEALKSVTAGASAMLVSIYNQNIRKKMEALNINADVKRVGGITTPMLTYRQLDEIMNKDMNVFSPFIEIRGTKYPLFRNSMDTVRVPRTKVDKDGSETKVLDNSYNATDSSGKLKANPPLINTPTYMGVSALANLTISQGDGRSVMNMLNNAMTSDLNSGVVYVYDGILYHPSDIEKGSLIANSGVQEAITANPLNTISKSLRKTLEALKGYDFDQLDSDLKSQLVKELFLDSFDQIPEALATIEQELNNLENQAELQTVLQKELKNIPSSYDQMASIAAPYSITGSEVDTSSMTKEELREYLQAKVEENIEAQKETKTEKEFDSYRASEELKKPRAYRVKDLKHLHNKISNRNLKQLLWGLTRNLNLNSKEPILHVGSKESLENLFYEDMVKTFTDKGIELSSRNLKQIKARAKEAFSEGSSGFYSSDTGKVYINNPREDVVVHEIIHKLTAAIIQAYVNGSLKEGSIHHTAMKNIEALFLHFEGVLQSSSDSDSNYMNLKWSSNVRNYLNQKAAIDLELSLGLITESEARYAKLSEFISWGLSDADVRTSLENIDASNIEGLTKFRQFKAIAGKVLREVISFLFGETNSQRFLQLLRNENKSILHNLELNTHLILNRDLHRQSKLSESLKELHHKVNLDDKLSHVYEPLLRAWENLQGNPGFVGSDYYDNLINRMKPEEVKSVEVSKAYNLAESVTNKVSSTGLLTDPKEIEAFRHVTAFLALGREVDPLVMSSAQRVFEKVLENLSVENFLPDNPTSHDYNVAQYKYDTLLGSGLNEVTNNDQGTILNNFIALTLVNEDFRDLVDKLGVVPRASIEKNSGVNSWIGSVGHTVIERITDGLAKNDLSQTASMQIINLFSNITAAPENAVVGGLNSLSSFTDKNMDLVEDYVGTALETALNTAGKLPKANSLKVIAATIKSDANADRLADDLLKNASEWKMPTFLKEFIFDIAGRTQTNKNVYDMMKQVRSYIQRRRQSLIEHLPQILKAKVPSATKEQLANFTQTMMGLDVGSLSFQEWKSAALDVNDRVQMIDSLYQRLSHYDTASLDKIAELAKFMADKSVVPASGAINAHNIVVNRVGFEPAKYRSELEIIDRLATLESMNFLNQQDVTSILGSDEEGMKFLHGTLRKKHEEEKQKLLDFLPNVPDASFNNLGYIKGYVPAHREGNEHFIHVSNDAASIKKAEERGYALMERVGAVAVMFSDSPFKAPFSQGIGQNATQHIGNMSLTNPSSMGSDYIYVGNDQVSLSSNTLGALKRETDITVLIGVNQARREEEYRGVLINQELVKNLKQMYDKSNGKGYINILDKNVLRKNPVLRDAVSILGKSIKDEAAKQFGRTDVLMVRQDMLNQVVGYRGGSVADFWNGTNRLPASVNAAVSSFADNILGKDALSKLLKAQAVYENLVADAKSIIVAKSFVVSAVNAISNAYHLMNIGVPVKDIVSKTPRKIAEIEKYVQGTVKEIEIEAALSAAETPAEKQKFRAELQSIRDSYKSLSIWPLIERGEFSTVTKDNITREDLLLTQGKFTSYMEKKMEKWPEWSKELGSNVIITKNSPVYEGLQKFVDYGDFVSKAIMYDHLTENKKWSKEKTLGEITEEFINYDLLPGRFRGTMERLGLLWFYNFKIRSTKIALRRLRRNPVRSLLVSSMPQIDVFGSLGIPINDNIFYKAANGSLMHSVGPMMGIRSPMLHPVPNALDALVN